MIKRSELCSTWTLNELVDRVTSNDSSYSDLIRLSFIQHFCRRRHHPSSSSAPGPSTRLSYVNVMFDNWSVSATVAVEIVVCLSCCHYWDRHPSSPTFVEDTVRRDRRWSARLFGDVEPRHLRHRRLLRRSGVILSLVSHDDPTLYDIVHYVGHSSSLASVPTQHVACARSSSRDVRL